MKCEEGSDVRFPVLQGHIPPLPAVSEAFAERRVAVIRQSLRPVPVFVVRDLKNRRGESSASAVVHQRPEPPVQVPAVFFAAGEAARRPPVHVLLPGPVQHEKHQPEIEFGPVRVGLIPVQREKSMLPAFFSGTPPDRTCLPRPVCIKTEQREKAAARLFFPPPDRTDYPVVLRDFHQRKNAPALISVIPPDRTGGVKAVDVPHQRKKSPVSVAAIPPCRADHIEVVNFPLYREEAEISAVVIPPGRTGQIEIVRQPEHGKKTAGIVRAPDRAGKPVIRFPIVYERKHAKISELFPVMLPEKRADSMELSAVKQRKHAATALSPVGGQRPAAGMVPAGERPEDRGGVPVMVEERTHREAAAVQVEQRPEHRSEVSAVIVERPEVDRAAVEADLDLPAGGGVPQRPVSAHAAHARQQQEGSRGQQPDRSLHTCPFPTSDADG